MSSERAFGGLLPTSGSFAMAKRHRCFLTLVLLVIGCCACSGEGVVVGPTVTRPADAGESKVWPLYASSGGGDEIRNCGWWRAGWRDFVDRKAMPAARLHGRVWIHNPGGVVDGQAMRFQQFTEASQQAALSGNDALKKVSEWTEFSEQMSRLSEVGELMIYLGCPATMSFQAEETDEEWFARALRELKPVLDIEPNPLVGFDATYGQPADASRGEFARFGGPDGLIARVIDHLTETGHEVIVEPKILVSAAWLRARAGICATDWYWETLLRNRDIRLPDHLPGWGDALKPTEIPGRQVRMLNLLWKKPIEEQRATIRATLDAGYDVTVGAGSEVLGSLGG